MATRTEEVARYVQRHVGEMLTNSDIAEALHIPEGTASSSMHRLMERLPIRKIAKGVYVYETTLRETIERALQANGQAMTAKEISEATGMSYHQVSGNISHLVRNPESPVIRVDSGVYQYSYEKIKHLKPEQESLPIPEEQPAPILTGHRIHNALDNKRTQIYYEEIDSLEDGTVLIRSEDGRILTAKATETEVAHIVRFGNRIHVIK